MKIFYVADTSLNNKSAYSQHVIKMCDGFGQLNLGVNLLLPEIDNKIKFNYLKKNFLLNSYKSFKFLPILNKKISNFLDRLIFGFKVAQNLKNTKNSLILTRSISSSFFLSLYKTHHFLEIHNEQNSFSKFIMINLNFINSKYIKKVIFISDALSKLYNLDKKKFIILHDATDPKNFSKKKKIKNIKRATYIGSFFKGRGIELIIQLAKKFKELEFYLYGEQNMRYRLNQKNLKFFKHIKYSKVPYILSNSDILLMPYSKNVEINAKNINTANYCSPLKMFDYLASGKVIISSRLDGICEILNHKKNALIAKDESVETWSDIIKKLIENKFNVRRISYNSIKTAKKYSWKNRAKEIIKYN